MCFICGRQFGRNSYAIHEKSCKKKFLATQAKLPPEKRKALPEVLGQYFIKTHISQI